MSPPDPARVAELLCAALELPESEQAAWVTSQCAGDEDLSAALLRLLAIDRRTDLAIDHPLEALVPMDASSPDEEPPPPERIGAFRILRKLGEGGMGSVWLAERVDGGFHQQVALKLIRLGMDSAAVTSQFRREREFLASLQHADIARLLDGGVDDRGRPWFAMEYVEGMCLRDWSAQVTVDLKARLTLFARLCRAVAYAHRRLIVHRDIKPSNIIVRADGTPCLLDFGIAKLLGDEDGEATGTASGFLTRGYAAPEQLRGEAITTGTDVFALGIVLFELLTGLNYARLRKQNADPGRPSRAMKSADDAGSHRIPAARLRGDLDAITLRALAEEPERRYPTAQALADDIDNHLAGRAVQARPDSMRYRIGKFVQRHRAAVAISVASILSLAVMSGVALWQARAKTIEAENARVALRRSESIRELLGSIFLTADPNAGRGVDMTVGELLAPALERIRSEAADDPAVAASLLEHLGNTFVSLGDDASAKAALAAALEFNHRADPPSAAIEGMAAARLAHYRALDGETGPALKDLETIVGRLRDGGPTEQPVLATALDLLSAVQYQSEEVDAALASSAESLTIWRALGDAHASNYLHALVGHADLAAAAEHNEESLETARLALNHPLMSGDAPPGLKAAVFGANARALQALGRYEEAEPAMAQVAAAFGAAFGAANGRTYYWHYRHAQVLQALGRLDEAQTIIDHLIANPVENDQPIARIAYAVVGADIAHARGASDAAARIDAAVTLACSENGHPRFCEKARGLQAD